MFVQGRTYRRRDLHKTHGGQRQGGISTPAGQSFILIFIGDIGEQYGYKDEWIDDVLFLYGAGPRGDMEFVRGNRAIRDHIQDGKDLHLFKYVRTAYVRYIGQMICTGHHERRGPDMDGHDRTIIVFELAPIDSFAISEGTDLQAETGKMSAQALKDLRNRALTTATPGATPGQRLTNTHARSEAVRAYVLARADGTCEACGQPAPFRTATGRLYLETHHIRRLSDAGPDDPRWVIALCPNCHRRAHHGEDKADFRNRAAQIVGSREEELAS